jgi:urea transport system permease protein
MENTRKKALLKEAAIVGAIGLIAILLIPGIVPDARLNQLGRFLALAIAALGIDLIWGYTGLLSLGHGVFFAIGGYAFAMHLKLQIPPNASSQLPEFMSLYGVTELPWFWQPFSAIEFEAFTFQFLPKQQQLYFSTSLTASKN